MHTDAYPTADTHTHGPNLIAHNDAGAVFACDCGAITLSMQYVSLRFEPTAFRALQALVAGAQRRLDHGDRSADTPAVESRRPGAAPPVH